MFHLLNINITPLSTNDIKKLKQLRKQLANRIAEDKTALQIVDEIIGTDKKVPVKSKKRLTNAELYNKFLQS